MKIIVAVGRCRTYIYYMTNTIKVQINEVEVEVTSISGSCAQIVTSLVFRKAGKVIKEASAHDVERFVRPENRAAVVDAINATKAAVAASDEHKTAAAKEAGVSDAYAHADRMSRTMAVQG